MKVQVIRWNFSNNCLKKRGVGYLSIAAKLGVLGGRASGKENGNAEKCARHVWKNKKKEQGWTVQQMTERDVGKARKNTSKSN